MNKFEELTGEEINKAKKLWIKTVQEDLVKSSIFGNLKQQLDLFQDDDDLWRCGSRLKNADMEFNQKYPFLIDRKHRFSDLLIQASHEKVMHNGVNETLCNIRQEYWIPKPRTKIKSILRNCVKCRKAQGKPYSYPVEPQLPKERVSANHSFETAGIDYLGPVYVKDVFSKDSKMHKAWIGLTTCATTRAIYLDLVSDCSGSSCVNLLKRLTAVHGTPKVMISDNGTNFICEEVQSYMANKGTLWKFNIQKAPWYGGFFERLVQSVKRCLRKVLTNARLTFEEMLTVIKQVECIINNRPLTYLYTEENVEPLTPNKLIYGRNINDSVMDNEVDLDMKNIDERFRHLQNILNHFWRRWSNEYLVSLRKVSRKSKSGIETPSIGDVVMIHDDNLRRQSWRIGKINKLLESRDGKVRACELITTGSGGKIATLRRPINRLYPFEHGRSESVTDNGEPILKFVDDRNIVTFLAVVAGNVK